MKLIMIFVIVTGLLFINHMTQIAHESWTVDVAMAMPPEQLLPGGDMRQGEDIGGTGYFVVYSRKDLSLRPDIVLVDVYSYDGTKPFARDMFVMPEFDQAIDNIIPQQEDDPRFAPGPDNLPKQYTHWWITFDTAGTDPICSLDIPNDAGKELILVCP